MIAAAPFGKRQLIETLLGSRQKTTVIAKRAKVAVETVSQIKTDWKLTPKASDVGPVAKASGWCLCGCGQATRVYLHDDPKTGNKCGDFYRFVGAHYHRWLRQRKPDWGKQSQRLKAIEVARKSIVSAVTQNPSLTLEELHKTAAPNFRIEGVSRILNYTRGARQQFGGEALPFVIIRRKAKPVPAITEFYPYFRPPEQCQSSESEIIEAVHLLVSSRVPSGMRADVSQELLLRIFSGQLTIATMHTALPQVIRKNWLDAQTYHTHVSLDAPLDEDGRTLADSLKASMEHNRFREEAPDPEYSWGGIDPREYQPEGNDGEIVGRY